VKLFWKPKPKTLNIAVVGNCQARPMAHLLTLLCPKINISAIGIVHLLNDKEQDVYEKYFHRADFIFAQRVTENYPCKFIRTNVLKNKWGNKVIVWPNMYYRGYNPELIYLRGVGRQPLRGPLGDYHNKTFIDGWAKGLSVKDTLDLHNSIKYNYEMYGQVPDSSLDALKMREKSCDVKITQYLEERLWKKRLFFTFNHPKNKLLLYTAKNLIKYTEVQYQPIKKVAEIEPLGQLCPPLNPWIKEKYGLDSDKVNIWKGLAVDEINENDIITGQGHEFQDNEIIDIFFQIYSANEDTIYNFLKRQNKLL
jgi:hypothetical protein